MTPPRATAGRRNRILTALAAAWIVISLAIGGAAADDSGAVNAPQVRAASQR